MSKRTREEVRKDILNALIDGKEHSYGGLERKANTNWKTVRDHCKELEMFKAVTISQNKVKITKEGKDILKRL
jgi:predicted transcriptional regulator